MAEVAESEWIHQHFGPPEAPAINETSSDAPPLPETTTPPPPWWDFRFLNERINVTLTGPQELALQAGLLFLQSCWILVSTVLLQLVGSARWAMGEDRWQAMIRHDGRLQHVGYGDLGHADVREPGHDRRDAAHHVHDAAAGEVDHADVWGWGGGGGWGRAEREGGEVGSPG